MYYAFLGIIFLIFLILFLVILDLSYNPFNFLRFVAGLLIGFAIVLPIVLGEYFKLDEVKINQITYVLVTINIFYSFILMYLGPKTDEKYLKCGHSQLLAAILIAAFTYFVTLISFS